MGALRQPVGPFMLGQRVHAAAIRQSGIGIKQRMHAWHEHPLQPFFDLQGVVHERHGRRHRLCRRRLGTPQRSRAQFGFQLLQLLAQKGGCIAHGRNFALSAKPWQHTVITLMRFPRSARQLRYSARGKLLGVCPKSSAQRNSRLVIWKNSP